MENEGNSASEMSKIMIIIQTPNMMVMAVMAVTARDIVPMILLIMVSWW